jgi:Family of unknown function (DUF5681)
MNAWKDLTNKVGYAKPPKHTRFTKGRSGNPKGRPTGSKNLATMMIEELTQPVAIVENGKRTKIPKIRAAVRQALNRAMVGDFKALQQIVIMLRSHDALKRVATTKPITNHPKDYANLSVKEAAELYQRTLSEDWED